MVFSYQENYLIVILIVPVLSVLYIQQKHKTTFILQSLIAVLIYIQWVEGREERWKSGWRPQQ